MMARNYKHAKRRHCGVKFPVLTKNEGEPCVLVPLLGDGAGLV